MFIEFTLRAPVGGTEDKGKYQKLKSKFIL